MRCNKHLSQCECPDMNKRLQRVVIGGRFASKKCAICGKHYELCKCENPQWTIEHKNEHFNSKNIKSITR